MSYHGRQSDWLIFQQNEMIAPNPSHRSPHGPLLAPLPHPIHEKTTLAGPASRPGGPSVGQNVKEFLASGTPAPANCILALAGIGIAPSDIFVAFGVGVGRPGEEGVL